jgi:Cu/Ag efflux pump CusA
LSAFDAATEGFKTTGGEVVETLYQRPLATVVIGVLFGSAFLTLFLLRVLNEWVCARESHAASLQETRSAMPS